MALQLFDRVLVTATANTTVSFTLGSAVTGYQSFSVMTNGDTTYYGASDGTNWEVGIGTYSTTGPTLTRTTILSSSNSGSAVTFSGSPNVWIDYPAGKSVYEDASNNVTLPGTLTSTGITTPSVTATTNDLTLSAISTGVVNVNTLAGKAFSVTDHPFTAGGSNVNFTRAFGGQVGYSTGLVANGSDSNVTFAFSAKGTSGIEFWTANLTERQLVVSRTASAVNYVQVTGAATSGKPTISAQGSDTNIDLNLTPKGTGKVNATNATSSIVQSTGSSGYGSFLASSSTGNSAFYFGYINNAEVGRISMTTSSNMSFGTSSSALEQLRVANTASAVNYVQVTGGATGVSPIISAQGSDGNIPLSIRSKGTFAVTLQSSAGTNLFEAFPTASSVNYLRVTPSIASSAPVLSAQGTDTNIDLALTPKGTGLVRFGTYVAGALTATGYINIKAADGTIYKVLVST